MICRADYAFGAALERDATKAITSLGGAVVGSIKNPPFNADYSSYLLTAQSSKAQVIGLANASADLINLVKQADSVAAPAVMAAMRALPVDDDAFSGGTVRQDGRVIHDFHLFQVKTPAESREPWDVYKLIDTVPATDAFRPLPEGGCPLVK